MITRTRLRCNEKDCPARESEEFHRPVCLGLRLGSWVAHSDEAQHQHVPKRSQGGKTVVAVLCSYCHDRIDNGPWGNSYVDGEYRIYDLHNNTLLRCYPLRVSTAEGEASMVRPDRSARHETLPSAADALPLASAPSREGAGPPAPSPNLADDAGRVAGPDFRGHGTVAVIPSSAFDRWKQQGQTLRNAIHSTPWAFGDWAIVGEDSFGEQAWNEISEGFDKRDYAKVRNWIWVARSIPPAERMPSLSWSHHRAVAHLDREERLKVLWEAAEKNLDRDALAALLPATAVAPKVVRFTVDELRERAGDFRCNEHRNHGPRFLAAYLDSLEAT